MENLEELRGESDDSRFQESHKEEGSARIANDKKDRESLKSRLGMCIHPVKPETHPEQVVNVTNGTLATLQVNVDEKVNIGHSQLLEFKKNLPTGFWKHIERKIKTMTVTKKRIAVGSNVLYDIQLIFSRVIRIHASAKEVDFKMSYHMSLLPSQLPYLMIQVRPK